MLCFPESTAAYAGNSSRHKTWSCGSLRQIVPLGHYLPLMRSNSKEDSLAERYLHTRLSRIDVSHLELPSGARSRPRGSAQFGFTYHGRARNFRGDVAYVVDKTSRVISDTSGLVAGYFIVRSYSHRQPPCRLERRTAQQQRLWLPKRHRPSMAASTASFCQT